jgi:hypothetical protein
VFADAFFIGHDRPIAVAVKRGDQLAIGEQSARGVKAHGAIRRPVLVALGLRPDDKKEVIDFHLAQSESAAEWERFLGDLIRRGLIADQLEMICVDGGSGLLAALPTAHKPFKARRRLMVVWLKPVRAAMSSRVVPLWTSLVSAAASSSGVRFCR